MKKTILMAASSAALAASLPAYAIGQKDGDDPAPDVAAQIKSLGDAIDGKISKLTEDNERLRADEKSASDTLIEKYKSDADERLTEFNAMKAEMKDLQQKMARGGGEPEAAKSAGQLFTESDGLKSLAANRTAGGRASVAFDQSLGVKDISSANGGAGAAGDAGALPVAGRGGLVDQPRRRMTVRGLLRTGVTSSNSFEYERLVTDTNAADVVAEGAAVPQTELGFKDEVAPVVDIGHLIRANRNILDDAPGLASFIDGRLRYGLAYKEELQLLLGSGAAGQLTGLVTAATAFSAPVVLAGTANSKIDVLRLAMLQSVVAEYAATGMVLNHIDWATIETTKDSTGQFVIGNPVGMIGPGLWGLPVVPTNAMTTDEFLVGDFDMGAELLDRMQSGVEASTEDGNNFSTRKVSVMAFERVCLPIYAPASFITGDFTTAVAAQNV